MNEKTQKYELLHKQIQNITEGESDAVAIMANTAALIHQSFGFWWTGFYRVEGNELILGPFQGPVACIHIPFGKGVCGSAWKEQRTLVVPDVEQFPGHIACSSESRSEIVVPVFKNNTVVAVLDIDSRELNTFDDTDARCLEEIAATVACRLPSPQEKEIYLAAGCFWGAEKYLGLINGVTFTEVGFANGNDDNKKGDKNYTGPTYKEVYTDTTGFAETVHLRYNPAVVSLRFLLEMYFKSIDPTSLNKQGEDEGTRYRTGIYYTDPADRQIIDSVMAAEKAKYDAPLQVEVEPLRNFYPADEYHQDYLAKNPNGYCHLPLALFELAAKARER